MANGTGNSNVLVLFEIIRLRIYYQVIKNMESYSGRQVLSIAPVRSASGNVAFVE